jgi:hypothetical protein
MLDIRSTVLLVSLFTGVASAGAQDRVPVFVKSVGADQGFTDPSKDRQDSVKDLTERIERSRVVRVVASEREATAVIEVLDRATTLHTNLLGPQNKSSLIVRLKARDYSTEFTGVSGAKAMLTGYASAASSVVDQLEAWVTSNRDRLETVKSGE